MFLALITLKFSHKMLIALLRHPQFEPTSECILVRNGTIIDELESFSICVNISPYSTLSPYNTTQMEQEEKILFITFIFVLSMKLYVDFFNVLFLPSL